MFSVDEEVFESIIFKKKRNNYGACRWAVAFRRFEESCRSRRSLYAFDNLQSILFIPKKPIHVGYVPLCNCGICNLCLDLVRKIPVYFLEFALSPSNLI